MRFIESESKIRGFSEIELTLFFLLVAFIVIAVHTCQDLSLESKAKEDIADISGYRIASDAFRTKYGQLPGDFNGAKALWPESINGNDNGYWEAAESAQVFKHLAYADMVEAADGVIFPKLSSTGQSVFPVGMFNKESTELMSDIFYGYPFPVNSFMMYFEDAANGNLMPSQKRVPHAAVAFIDGKIDDGNAVTGNMRVAFNNPDFFGISSVKEVCAYSNGKYRTDENDNLFCNFIIKY